MVTQKTEQMQKSKMDGACSTHGETKHAVKIIIEELR